MKFFYLFIIVIVLTSCKQNYSPIAKQLVDADSLIIQFNAPGTDSIVKTVVTTQVNAIGKLSHFVDDKPSPLTNCSFDGNLLFYKNNSLTADIAFNLNIEGCKQFVFMLNGQLAATKLNNEASSFLKSLAEGKEWY